MTKRAAQKAKRGRPTRYARDTADQILSLLADGQSLREICRADDMPSESTVRLWAVNDTDGFSARYTSAREAQMDRFAEEIVEIADDGTNDWMTRQNGDETITVVDHEHINRSRLRVDARKWLMAKMAPKRFGDKIGVEHSGTVSFEQQVAEAASRRRERG